MDTLPDLPFQERLHGESLHVEINQRHRKKKQFCSNYNLEREEHAHGKFAVLNRFFLNRFTRDLVEKGI